MQFGHFDDAKKEYVITSPKTPLPWINYLGSENFFSLISNTCGGYSFYKDAKLLRLTRYRYNDTPLDQNGRYYYIKDGDTVWNPGWQPTQTPLDSYECHHGLGYSRFVSSKNLVAAELTAFCSAGRFLRSKPSHADQQRHRRKNTGSDFFCRVLLLERRGRYDQLPEKLQHRRS